MDDDEWMDGAMDFVIFKPITEPLSTLAKYQPQHIEFNPFPRGEKLVWTPVCFCHLGLVWIFLGIRRGLLCVIAFSEEPVKYYRISAR